MPMSLEAMSSGCVAVITGGASGIGLAAAIRFAKAGMKVCIADIGLDRLTDAETKMSSAAGGSANVMTAVVDVSRTGHHAEARQLARLSFDSAIFVEIEAF
jgi:NAD(P)-dependent dehydrogenase (short-subunit alcohol dehydrogenase family)